MEVKSRIFRHADEARPEEEEAAHLEEEEAAQPEEDAQPVLVAGPGPKPNILNLHVQCNTRLPVFLNK
jgi:hypothetical protein